MSSTSNSHISGSIFQLMIQIRDLNEAIEADKKSRSELEAMHSGCKTMLEEIIERATEQNEDIGPNMNDLIQAEAELRNLEKEIQNKTRTIWETISNVLSNI